WAPANASPSPTTGREGWTASSSTIPMTLAGSSLAKTSAPAARAVATPARRLTSVPASTVARSIRSDGSVFGMEPYDSGGVPSSPTAYTSPNSSPASPSTASSAGGAATSANCSPSNSSTSPSSSGTGLTTREVVSS